jgi:hypothetical protein
MLVLAAAAGCGGTRAPAPAPPPTPPAPPHAIDDPYFSTDADPSPEWIEQWREPLRVGGATYALVGRDWPGEGQSITVERDGRVVGAYRFGFGGLGGVLEIARRCAGPDRVVLMLRAAGTTRPYWLLPGQHACTAETPEVDGEDLDADPCYVRSETEVTYVELAIDAHRVWLAGTSDHPPASCP